MYDVPVPFTTEWVKDGHTYTYVVRDQRGNHLEANPGWTVTRFPEGAGWKLMRYGDELIDEGMFVSLGLAIQRANAVMAGLSSPPTPKGPSVNAPDDTLLHCLTAEWVRSERLGEVTYLFLIRNQHGVIHNADSGWMVTRETNGKGWTLIQYGRKDNINHGTYVSAERAMDMASHLMVKLQPLIGRFEQVEGKEEYYLAFRNASGQAIDQSVEIKARLVNPERPHGDWELVKYTDEDAYPKQITQLTREAWLLIRQGTFPHLPS